MNNITAMKFTSLCLPDLMQYTYMIPNIKPSLVKSIFNHEERVYLRFKGILKSLPHTQSSPLCQIKKTALMTVEINTLDVYLNTLEFLIKNKQILLIKFSNIENGIKMFIDDYTKYVNIIHNLGEYLICQS